MLLPYLWQWRGRVLLALGFLIAAKLSVVGVPIVLKRIVDALSAPAGLVAVPLALVLVYGVLRVSNTLFTEFRELIFSRVTEGAVRTVALEVFRHLHAMSMRFHLERQTGGLTRDIERGTRAIGSLVSYTLYSVLPTLIEIVLVLGYLGLHYDPWFSVIAAIALVLYIVFTFVVTEWRTQYRRRMNELDSRANARAIDSLLNYETVKYFGNEEFEAQRYDETLRRYEAARIRSQVSLTLLNVGQSLIIAAAVTVMVWRATAGVAAGNMTLGDLVLVNGFMIQLYMPLNFLGVLYREIKQGLSDLERMFSLLDEQHEITDRPGAQPLGSMTDEKSQGEGQIGLAADRTRVRGPSVVFRGVSFHYDPSRPILQGVDFEVPPGNQVAIVGPSGAGKSTLSRLLFRFYDVTEGAILIDGQDIRDVTQQSLRAAIGIVPQDTVLFNDSLRYNVAYGRPGASDTDVEQACRAARLDEFIQSLPRGYDTPVGERGLKLSGGEKQRVAIARMLLKDPAVLILDEATSALDTRNEQAIQGALREVASGRTSLVIAHRLSTVVEADCILVLDHGLIVERGTHSELLARGGIYARMWSAQAQDLDVGDDSQRSGSAAKGSIPVASSSDD